MAKKEVNINDELIQLLIRAGLDTIIDSRIKKIEEHAKEVIDAAHKVAYEDLEIREKAHLAQVRHLNEIELGMKTLNKAVGVLTKVLEKMGEK